jgi:transcriptional regulator with XRE-family HTH domain
MTQDEGWGEALHARIAAAIRQTRFVRRMSAQDVADETACLGYPLSRSQIANYESGRKQGLDVAELMVLAAALRVPPVMLLFGGLPDEAVEFLPGEKATSVATLAWFIGDREIGWPGPEFEPDEARAQTDAVIADPGSPTVALLDLIRARAEKHREIHLARWALSLIDEDPEQFGRALARVGELAEHIENINAVIVAAVAQSEGETE